MPATEMDLRHFGLGKDKVLSIKNTIINTANGLIYGLYDDQSISFVGVGKN
ncbi:hypothetical protein [Candidatus Regiella insecticola]|nr:hypothetical protein [Candidatus Regiella insecticola]